MDKNLFLVLSLVLLGTIFAGCVGPEETIAPTTTPPPAPMYKGTIYIAGEGGHIAVADVEINPSETETPIKLASSLSRIYLNPASVSPIHDVRVDASDETKMYWSAIKNDSDGKIHYGTVDLKTNTKVEDKTVDKDTTYTGGPMYCGSGQNADKFLPVFMGYEGFIEIFDKGTLESEGRVFFRGDDFDPSYTFMHGINTPDMKKFLLISNGVTGQGTGDRIGKVNLYLLDMNSLVNGGVNLLKKNALTGYPASMIAFRQTFTPDGKYLLQSGRDRFFLIDANTLELVAEQEMKGAIENHDAMPTPDGKYAILTLRVPVTEDGASVMDGHIQLYDIANNKLVGKSVSVCKGCHGTSINFGKDAMLCGEDAVWQ